jgi:serine/threonine-protein kinase
MAQVFVGDEPQLGRKVAIKVLLAEHCTNEQIVSRFTNEARALGRIHHPGVVEILDVDRLEDGRVCLIMEHLEGQSLHAFLHHRRRLGAAEALPLMLQLADTMAAAHDQGIIHRDLKPENIFLVSDVVGGIRTKVLDFGIAKLLEGAGAVATATRTKMGTGPYMPPEQFKSARSVDHRSDIYSLGCVFFELLGGRPPFMGTTLFEHMKAHAFEPPPPLRKLVPDAPEALERIVARMLAKEREHRFQSMRDLKAALEAFRDGAPVAEPAAAKPASTSEVSAKRWPLVVAIAAVLVVIGAGIAVVAALS